MALTQRKIDSIHRKIARIKKVLAAERKMFGGFYDDSRGLRYVPSGLYLEIGDYTGALRHFNWFQKNFPNDGAYGVFFLEWALTLFMRKRKKEAEVKILHAFRANPYLIDAFLKRPLRKLKFATHYQGFWWDNAMNKNPYSAEQEEFKPFVTWLEAYTDSDVYKECIDKYIEIQMRLEGEPTGTKRFNLIDQSRHLWDDYEPGKWKKN